MGIEQNWKFKNWVLWSLAGVDGILSEDIKEPFRASIFFLVDVRTENGISFLHLSI